MYSKTSILVSSCDKYSAAWAPFCHGLNKYWPEHPENLFFITNTMEAPCGVSIKVGEDKGWAANLIKALQLIESEFILYSQEDYWIQRPVPDQNIREYLSYLENRETVYIRLYPAPPPDLRWTIDNRLGIIKPTSAYRTSLQMALWRKETLLSLLISNETPWEFEVKGAVRSQQSGEKFLCVQQHEFGIDYVFTAIMNGYWTDEAKKYAQREGFDIDLTSLPLKSNSKTILDKLIYKAYKIKRRFFYE